MVGNKDVHTVDVFFDPGAAAVFNGIHDAVDHDLRTEGIIAGHGHHAALGILAAGRDAVGILSAAFGAGAIVGHNDGELRKRLAPDIPAGYRRVIVHNGEPSENQGAFIVRRVEDNAAAGCAVDPGPVPAGVITGKDQDMLPALISRKESEIAGQKLGGVDSLRVGILTGGAGTDLHAHSGIVDP